MVGRSAEQSVNSSCYRVTAMSPKTRCGRPWTVKCWHARTLNALQAAAERGHYTSFGDRAMLLAFVLVLAFSFHAQAADSVTFEFVHGNDKAAPTYRASTTDQEVIRRARAELGKPLKDRMLHIHGKLGKGSDDNAPWSWHFEANTWGLDEISTEFCDGNPTHVEENLQDWLKLGSYCPYAARVSKELKQ